MAAPALSRRVCGHRGRGTGVAGKAKILIVEDDSAVASVLKEFLEQMGYEVPPIQRFGENALEVTCELAVDLVLLDIQLAGEMDGTEVAEALRDLNVPFVFLTAYADTQTLDRAKITTPYGYVVKPFEPRALQVAVEIAIYRHKVESERELLLKENQLLRSFLPVCAWCNKIRSGAGQWQTLTDYAKDTLGIEVSHAMCQTCASKFESGPSDT